MALFALTPALPMNPVAQTFLSAGSGDFPVASPCSSAGNAGQECPANPQTGMSALHTGSGAQGAHKVRGILSPKERENCCQSVGESGMV